MAFCQAGTGLRDWSMDNVIGSNETKKVADGCAHDFNFVVVYTSDY
jgi:hypothetical protein